MTLIVAASVLFIIGLGLGLFLLLRSGAREELRMEHTMVEFNAVVTAIVHGGSSLWDEGLVAVPEKAGPA